MSQQSFSDMEYSLRKRTTKRDEFLDIMDEIIPWEEWVDLIKPHYFIGKRGRPPKGIEKMLRMYLLQCWFNLSDEGVGMPSMTAMLFGSLWASIFWRSRCQTPQHSCTSGG
jgi:hypothetical protein